MIIFVREVNCTHLYDYPANVEDDKIHLEVETYKRGPSQCLRLCTPMLKIVMALKSVMIEN